MSQSEPPRGGSEERRFPFQGEAIFWFAAISGLLVLGWSLLCAAPSLPWNAARLAPSFALARGLPIYALRDSGAHLGWFYGPVFPLWYLPFGFFENLTIAPILALGWNLVTLLLPVFIVMRVALAQRPAVVAIKATVVGAILLLANPITHAAFYFLHVDAVCVACVLTGCVALQAGVGRGWRPGLPVAALAFALSVGSKQLAVTIVPATLVWLWREGHGRHVRAWLFWNVLIGGGLAAIFLLVFGAEELVFNTWFVLSRTPWAGSWQLLGMRIIELARAGWVWWLAAGVSAWLLGPRKLTEMPAEAGALVRLLTWAALWQAPFGLLAALKAGGGLNSIHALVYGLVAGLIVITARLTSRSMATTRREHVRMLGALGGLVIGGLVADWQWAGERGIRWTPYQGLDELVAQARRSPGKIYLPWNPLITIVTENKIYPFDDALLSLWRADLEPPIAVIRAAVPAGAVIIYEEPSQSRFALNYFGPEARAAAHPKRGP